MADDNIKWPTGRYRLTQKASMPRAPGGESELLDIGTEVIHDGKPAPHMVALDEDAELAVMMAGDSAKGSLDPFNSMPLNMGDEEQQRVDAGAKALAGALALVLPDIVAKIVEAIVPLVRQQTDDEGAKGKTTKKAADAAPPPPAPPPPAAPPPPSAPPPPTRS